MQHQHITDYMQPSTCRVHLRGLHNQSLNWGHGHELKVHARWIISWPESLKKTKKNNKHTWDSSFFIHGIKHKMTTMYYTVVHLFLSSRPVWVPVRYQRAICLYRTLLFLNNKLALQMSSAWWGFSFQTDFLVLYLQLPSKADINSMWMIASFRPPVILLNQGLKNEAAHTFRRIWCTPCN